MASFPPFKAFLLQELDDLARHYGLQSPFLDAGCGQGDVSAHLAARGWTGVALDVSDDAVRAAGRTLEPYPSVSIVQSSLAASSGGPFETVILFDVLEHVPDDLGALRVLAALQPPGGMLVATIPTHPEREWRWDDEFYGHVRRYDVAELRTLFGHAGYDIIEMRDVTFPVLWGLRRAYTRLKRRPDFVGTPEERTRSSSDRQAWDLGFLSRVLSFAPAWKPAFALQRRYGNRTDLGHEVILLARLSDGPGDVDEKPRRYPATKRR